MEGIFSFVLYLCIIDLLFVLRDWCAFLVWSLRSVCDVMQMFRVVPEGVVNIGSEGYVGREWQ